MPRQGIETTAKYRIVELLKTYPDKRFTSREISEALAMKHNSTSAFISAYLPSVQISRVGETRHSGGGWTPTYQYDPNKVLVEVVKKPAKAKKDKTLPVRVPRSVTQPLAPGLSLRADEHYTKDMYAKVVFRDDDTILLVAENGDVIKGRVMQG